MLSVKLKQRTRYCPLVQLDYSSNNATSTIVELVKSTYIYKYNMFNCNTTRTINTSNTTKQFIRPVQPIQVTEPKQLIQEKQLIL